MVHRQSYTLLLGDDNGGDGWFRRLLTVDLSRLRFHHTIRAQSLSPDALAPVDLMRGEVERPSPVILGAGGAVLHCLCTDSHTVLTLDAD